VAATIDTPCIQHPSHSVMSAQYISPVHRSGLGQRLVDRCTWNHTHGNSQGSPNLPHHPNIHLHQRYLESAVDANQEAHNHAPRHPASPSSRLTCVLVPYRQSLASSPVTFLDISKAFFASSNQLLPTLEASALVSSVHSPQVNFNSLY